MPYVTAEILDEVVKSLEEDSIKLFQWFSDKQMNANHDKCHLPVSGKNNVTMDASGFKIKNTDSVKSVQIRGYFWSVFSCIRPECRKIRTRNKSVFGHISRSN